MQTQSNEVTHSAHHRTDSPLLCLVSSLIPMHSELWWQGFHTLILHT